MNIIPAIANSLWLASSLPASTRFRAALHRPAETQRQLLQNYVARNADTLFGRAHGFSEIKSYREFAQRVPLNGYDDLKPWINRIRRGEKNVLTAEPVTHLVPTSGSTDARKLIPFTTALQQEFNRAIGPWIVDLASRYPSIAFGSAYWSISPALTVDADEQSAVPIGFEDDSAYLGGIRKQLVNAVMAVPSEMQKVFDMEQFRYLTLLCLLRKRDLSFISVWHPSFLSLLLDTLPAFWDHLMEDIKEGSCRYTKFLPKALLYSLKLRPLPQLVKELVKANPTQPATVWPHLKIISCWGGGYAQFSQADLARRLPATIIQSKGLLATECVVTIPYGELYPLAITSHFFEFIDGHRRVCLADELQEGQTYEVIVTTSGGLWRYRLGDLVQVTGFVGKTPSLNFLGRTGDISDRYGEKLSEGFVADTIQAVTASLPSPPRFALLAPDDTTLGCCYTLYIEGNIVGESAEQLERKLCENVHYAWCRKLGQLQPLRIFSIKSGGYETFITRQQLGGKRMGEIKPCVLSTENGWTQRFCGDYLIH